MNPKKLSTELLEAWLGGSEAKQEQTKAIDKEEIVAALTAKISEKVEPAIKKSEVLLALASVRNWAESPEGSRELEGMSPRGIVKYVLGRLELSLD